MKRFSQRQYPHSFFITPIDVGKIYINRGFVYTETLESALAVFDVQNATKNLFYGSDEIIQVNSDQEVFVIIKHAKKDETFLFCDISECFISTEQFDSNEYTRVSIGSVKWTGLISSVTQTLAGDIYCRIPGTKNNSNV